LDQYIKLLPYMYFYSGIDCARQKYRGHAPSYGLRNINSYHNPERVSPYSDFRLSL
jgi:hypothetical protein